jgi:hypothetical protein
MAYMEVPMDDYMVSDEEEEEEDEEEGGQHYSRI